MVVMVVMVVVAVWLLVMMRMRWMRVVRMMVVMIVVVCGIIIVVAIAMTPVIGATRSSGRIAHDMTMMLVLSCRLFQMIIVRIVLHTPTATPTATVMYYVECVDIAN